VQSLLWWKSDKCYIVSVCVCSLSYEECNAHAPYCYLWHVRLYKILRHCLINDNIFRRKLLKNRCLSHSKENAWRYDYKNTQIFMKNIQYSWQILIKHEEVATFISCYAHISKLNWTNSQLSHFIFWRNSPPPPCGLRSPHSRGFYITHNNAPHSVGLLCTSDQLVAEIST
jgi:hypothetical protein